MIEGRQDLLPPAGATPETHTLLNACVA